MYQYPPAPLSCTQTPEKEMEKECASHVPTFEAAVSYDILTWKTVAEIQILGEWMTLGFELEGSPSTWVLECETTCLTVIQRAREGGRNED